MKGGKMNKDNSKIKRFLEIPKEVISNEPKITILGFREMLIENYKGILEFRQTFSYAKSHFSYIINMPVLFMEVYHGIRWNCNLKFST